MKINGNNHDRYANQDRQASGAGSGASASFSSALASATAGMNKGKPTEFTNMTRQEMFDWMNDQVRSGKMSLNDTSSFLAMTIKISAATGQPVDMASDAGRYNFIEKARHGVEGAMSRGDRVLAMRLQSAIDMMLTSRA